MARQIFLAENFCYTDNALAFFARNLQQRWILARDFRDRCVPQETHHLAGEVRRAVPFADQVVNLAENIFAPAFRHCLHHLFQNVRGRGADQIADRVGRDASAGGSDGLVENRQRIAHGAVAGFGEQGESVVIGLNVFAGDQVTQLGDDGVELHGTEAEVLAARADGLRNVLGLRGREHEDDVVRWLLQRLEQRVERGVGNLMGFVENVNFEAVARWLVACALAQFADFVDAAIGSGVDFNDINSVSGTNLSTRFADSAGLGRRLILRTAIESGGQNSGDGGLADATMAAENVAVGGAALFDGILQGPGNVLLSDDLGEFLRTVFAGQDGVTHGRKSRLYGMGGQLGAAKNAKTLSPLAKERCKR